MTEQQKTAALIETDYTVYPLHRLPGRPGHQDHLRPLRPGQVTASNYDPVGNLTSRSVTRGSTSEQTDCAYDTLGDVTS